MSLENTADGDYINIDGNDADYWFENLNNLNQIGKFLITVDPNLLVQNSPVLTVMVTVEDSSSCQSRRYSALDLTASTLCLAKETNGQTSQTYNFDEFGSFIFSQLKLVGSECGTSP